jgi:hypothetical protein
VDGLPEKDLFFSVSLLDDFFGRRHMIVLITKQDWRMQYSCIAKLVLMHTSARAGITTQGFAVLTG